MEIARRRFVMTGGCLCLVPLQRAFAGNSATAPVLAVIDVDQPDTRTGFQAFSNLVDRRFAGQPVKPKTVFIASEQGVNETNLNRLRAALAMCQPDIVLASNDGFADMLRVLNLGKPVLFFTVLDPVAIGLTDSLIRPRLGMTGFAVGANSDLKRTEMLLRLAPKARNIGHLSSADFDRDGNRGPPAPTPHMDNVTVRRFEFDTPAQLTIALATDTARKMDAWDVSFSYPVFQHSEAVVDAIGRLRRPAIYPRMRFVNMGGMAAFEPRIDEADEAWVSQVASLLAGVPLEQIPVVQATRYRFGINLKTCHRVGIDPPKSLIKIADVVLE